MLAQVVAEAYQLFFQTFLFNDDCKVCKLKADAYKTWANFKVDFSIAHQGWWESQATSAGCAGFQSTNIAHQKDTLDAFVSLSTSTTSNRAAVAALTVTNSTLTDDCNVTNSSLVTDLQDVSKLQASVANLKRPLSTTSSACYTTTTNHHYCWTCVHRCDHNIKRCPNTSSGHQYDATRDERKGGTNKSYKPAN